MTNNPTIDGVSREDERHAAVKALHDVMQSVPSASLYSLSEAVLDAGYAPAVERQEPVVYAWIWSEMLDGEEVHDGISFGPNKPDFKSRNGTTFDYAPLYTCKDVATLQSTIAQLQVRVAELESERGDVIHQVRTHGSDVWEDISGESLELCQCQPEEYEIRKLYTAPPAPVDLSFSFEHPTSKEKRTVTMTKRDVFDGMEDYFYEKLGEQICQCESVGETNVIDCNCDEYVHDFEIVNTCLDATAALNGPAK